MIPGQTKKMVIYIHKPNYILVFIFVIKRKLNFVECLYESNLEMIKPPRPVRRPEEFYQVFLGGVDTDYMKTTLGGFTGCLRGLSVGGKLLDLTSKAADGIARGKCGIKLFEDFDKQKSCKSKIKQKKSKQTNIYSPHTCFRITILSKIFDN